MEVHGDAEVYCVCVCVSVSFTQNRLPPLLCRSKQAPERGTSRHKLRILLFHNEQQKYRNIPRTCTGELPLGSAICCGWVCVCVCLACSAAVCVCVCVCVGRDKMPAKHCVCVGDVYDSETHAAAWDIWQQRMSGPSSVVAGGGERCASEGEGQWPDGCAVQRTSMAIIPRALGSDVWSCCWSGVACCLMSLARCCLAEPRYQMLDDPTEISDTYCHSQCACVCAFFVCLTW